MSTPDSFPAQPLPSGFTTIADIRNLPNEQLMAKVPVNVVGFVKDFMPPTQTRGTSMSDIQVESFLRVYLIYELGFKCTIEIMDHSVQNESYGLQVSFFWPEEKMPTISGPADVVLLRNVKVKTLQS